MRYLRLFKKFLLANKVLKKIWIKDIILNSEEEHIYRAIFAIKKKEIDKINPNAIIIDVGAAFGKFSKIFINNFPNRKVVAFEPLKYSNSFNNKNLTWRNVILSDQIGKTKFFITKNMVSSSVNEINNEQNAFSLKIEDTIEVNTTTLDYEFPSDEILILKLDAQGNELKILQGASSILRRTKCVNTEMLNHNIYLSGCKYYMIDEILRQNDFELADISIFKRDNGINVIEYDAIYFKKQ